jgi:hypothetical protein
MTHTEEHPLLETLSAHLDGELVAGDVTALEQHLGRCAGCRMKLEELQILARATADEETPPVPEGLAARVVQRLDEELARGVPGAPAAGAMRHRPPWLWRGGPLAAAASFLGAAILWRLWLAGPAPVAPLKTLEPDLPAVQQTVPAPAPLLPTLKKERRKAGNDALEEEPARQDAPSMDSEFGFASEGAAVPEAKALEAAPPQDELLMDADAPGPQETGVVGAARAMAPESLQKSKRMQAAFLSEEDAAQRAVLQEEEHQVRVTLTRDGSLLVEAPGYRCQLDLDMEDGLVWSAASEAADRNMLGQFMVKRFRADLEDRCGPLPDALAVLPQN